MFKTLSAATLLCASIFAGQAAGADAVYEYTRNAGMQNPDTDVTFTLQAGEDCNITKNRPGLGNVYRNLDGGEITVERGQESIQLDACWMEAENGWEVLIVDESGREYAFPRNKFERVQ